MPSEQPRPADDGGDSVSPPFSIIVPTKDRPEYLAEALESVAAQTIQDFECIVVDDCGGIAADLGRYQSDPRFRLIRRSSSGGPAAARNSGIEQAAADVLMFLDDDDLYEPDRLQIASEGLHRAPIALCWARYADEDKPHRGRDLHGDLSDTILDGMTPHLNATAVRRDLAPRFDESYAACEDVEWWLRLAPRGRVSTVPRWGVRIRRHEGPRTTHGAAARVAQTLRMLDHHEEYFEAHRRAHAFRLMRAALTARSIGDHRQALDLLWRSLRTRPSARVAWHIVRTLAQTRLTQRASTDGA